MKPNRTYTGFCNALATAALLASAAPISAQAQNRNPWNPYPSGQAQPEPAPVPAPAKPKYYQEPVATPAATNTPTASGPSRFAPADLDMRLSVGLPAQPDAQASAPAIPNPYLTRQATVGAPQNPYAPAPGYANPGYGAAYPGYGTGYGQAYPGYGAPYASNGIPGGYNSFQPPPGNIASNPFSGFGFSPFGFW